MRYSTGQAVGSGLGKAMSALVNARQTQSAAYEDQLNSLAKRDYHKSSTDLNNAKVTE